MATFGHLFSHFIGIPVNKDLNYCFMRTRWRLFQKRVVCTKFDIHVFAQLVLEKSCYKAEFKSMQAYTLVFNTCCVVVFILFFFVLLPVFLDCPFYLLLPLQYSLSFTYSNRLGYCPSVFSNMLAWRKMIQKIVSFLNVRLLTDVLMSLTYAICWKIRLFL